MRPPAVGIVHLVGAGPGDPGLLTRRGHDALARADVVVYDGLANDRLLGIAPGGAVRIYAGKSKGAMAIPQDQINGLLVDQARMGRRVVRLKGGDPYVFGRGAEEAEHLRAAGVPFVVVPGVTAGVGVTSYAGLAVTHRAASSAVAFVTGHDDPDGTRSDRPPLDWAALAAFPGTLVIYMGVTRLGAICRTLGGHGMPAGTPAAMVESGTLPRQRTVVGTLASLADRVAASGLGPPALVVIGEVVARRDDLAWFERLPLFGRRIVVTRPLDEASEAAASLEALGAEAIVAPTVEVRPLDDPGPLDRALSRLAEFDWLVFTSANGVRHALDRLGAIGLDLRALGRIRLAAIGPATAATLASYRLRADLVPPEYRSEALAESLVREATGRRVLLVRADRGRDVLREVVGRVATVEQVAAYRNVDAGSIPDEVVRRIEAGSVDWITLTSSAIATRLVGLLPPTARARIGREVRLASLSPVTTATVEALGYPVSAEAAEATWPGLVEAIVGAETEGRSPFPRDRIDARLDGPDSSRPSLREE